MASTTGSNISVVAVLLIHIEQTAQASITPSTGRLRHPDQPHHAHGDPTVGIGRSIPADRMNPPNKGESGGVRMPRRPGCA